MINFEKNSFGKINLSRQIIDNVIEESIHQNNGNLLLSSSKGKISKKYEVGNSSQNSISYDVESGILNITIFVSFKFGSSLNKETKILSENIFKLIKEKIGKQKVQLKINVRGIILKDIVKKETDLEIILKNYDEN